VSPFLRLIRPLLGRLCFKLGMCLALLGKRLAGI
jgi:hypothetical protein